MTLLFRLLTVAWLCCAAMAATNVVPVARSVSMGTNGLQTTTVPYALTSTLLTNSPMSWTNSAFWVRDAGMRFEASTASITNRILWGQSGTELAWIERYNWTGDMVFGVQGGEKLRIMAYGAYGFGTAAPEEVFHLTSSSVSDTVMLVENTGASGAYNKLRTDGQFTGLIVKSTHVNGQEWFAGQYGDNRFRLLSLTHNVSGLVVRTNGNVSIGRSLHVGNPLGTDPGDNNISLDGSLGYDSSITARLHLPAGTATANSAALKFTSGATLTSVEPGAVEWAGKALTFTTDAGTRVRLSGRIGGSITATGNVGTGEDDLQSFSIPANTFTVNESSVRVRCSGTFANNANNKQVKVKVGSVTAFATGSAAFTDGKWVLTAEVLRTGVDAQLINVSWVCSAGTTGSAAVTTATEDDASAITFKLTGEATDNDDIVQRSMVVELLHAQ